nr:hypothetical protein CFP56_28022 [Quercus suber]
MPLVDADLDECLEHKTDPLSDSSLHDIMRRNANLKSEVAALHEHIKKVKKETIEEYQAFQPYFDEIGGYYGDGFEDFRKQAVLMFSDLDFSQIQIKLTTPTTPTAEPTLDNVETDEEVLVINGPGGWSTALIKFNAIKSKLSLICNDADLCFKYQFPGEDLDALISVMNDKDLEHMMLEYDRLLRGSTKPARLMLYLFVVNSMPASFLTSNSKSEQ